MKNSKEEGKRLTRRTAAAMTELASCSAHKDSHTTAVRTASSWRSRWAAIDSARHELFARPRHCRWGHRRKRQGRSSWLWCKGHCHCQRRPIRSRMAMARTPQTPRAVARVYNRYPWCGCESFLCVWLVYLRLRFDEIIQTGIRMEMRII